MLVLSCGSDVRVASLELEKNRRFVPDNREMFGYIKDLTSFGYQEDRHPGLAKGS